jgi:hypothetical protein
MAFPTDLEIEVAFNNDIDETDYAQSGWTSVLPFVAGFSGDLRGRSYELDRAEAGTVTVTLDNADSRFLPGSVQSPYYPYVKSDRRFRIRGKNMVHPNVARGGSRDRDLTGFLSGSGLNTDFTLTVYGFDEVRAITASAEPNAGQGKEKINDGLAGTMWTINTQAGWIQYQFGDSVQMQRYTLQIPAGNATRNPKNWTLQGSNNGSSWTTIHTVTNNVWTEDYEVQEFTITSPGFYLYYRLDITVNTGAVANTQLAEWDLYVNDPATDFNVDDDDLTHYVETKVLASRPINQWYETLSWYGPLEYGVRLAHSAMVWRISGTEPTGAKYKLHITYLDSELKMVNTTDTTFSDPRQDVTSLPTSQVPTQIGFSHTPPSDAKYGIISLAVYIGGTTNSTDLVYGVTGIQAELPTNLAPDISGFRDTFNWQIQSEDAVPGTVTTLSTTGTVGTIVETTSPAYVTSNATTVTTASFTPANNSLLVAMAASGNGSRGVSSLGTVTDSLGGSWTRIASDFLSGDSISEVWIRDVVTGAAMTVTYDPGGTGASGQSLKVQVLTGAKPVAQQTGGRFSANGTINYTGTITTTLPNSRVYGSYSRPTDEYTLLPFNSNTTVYGQIHGTAIDFAAAFKSTNAIASTGNIELGFDGEPVVGDNYIAMAEILATNQAADDPTTAYLSVTWAVADSNLFITIPHLIPGQWYTATVEAQKVGSQPNVLFSGNEGLTGALINTTSMTQYTTTFQAQQAEQEIRFILQGTPTATEGLRLRKLRVERGENLVLSLPTSATETGITVWTRPKDIFEGWVESWPAVAGSLTMSITAVDRMKRLGEVELSNTLREAMLSDSPALMLPLTDSMLDSPGRFSQLGYWADVEDGPTYVDISHSRGDLLTASYSTQTDDGPTEEASLVLVTASSTVGYFLSVPYSRDFETPTTVPPPKPKPRPAPTKPKPTQNPKYIYTKKWYATWSRSYEGNDSTRFDDSDYMYQGQFSGSPGNQKSLAGFDYKNMMATLDGAEILECHITVKNDHARWNKGLYVFVGYHAYSSKPSTWSSGSVAERKWKKWVTEGGSATIDAGTAIGRGFREGTTRGISIGPESDSDNYGFFRGATQSGKPYITIKYRK